MTDSLERTLILARAALAPSIADDDRARRALGLRPQALADSPAAAPTRPGVWSALRASGAGGAAIGALLLGLGFAAGYWMARGSELPRAALAAPEGVSTLVSPTPPPTTTPAVGRDAALDAHPTLAQAPDPLGVGANGRDASPPSAPRARPQRAAARAPDRAVRPAAPEAARVPDPGDELALLRRIEKSLRAGEPALALALLGELEERFPSTRLDEERAAAAVLVHCALGDPGSRRRAEAFISERAASVYADRVRSGCFLGVRPHLPELPAPEPDAHPPDRRAP